MLFMRIGRFRNAMDVLNAAYELAKRGDDRELYLWTTVAVVKCASVMQNLDLARERATEATATFEEIGDDSGRLRMLIMDMLVAAQSGDFVSARAATRKYISLLDADIDGSTTRRLRNQATIDLGEFEYALGNFAQAAAIGRRNVETFTDASASLRVHAIANLCIYLVCEGSFAEAESYARRGIALAREIGSTLFLASMAQALAMMALHRKDRTETAAQIFGWASRLFEAGGLDVFDRITRGRLEALLNDAFSAEDLAAWMERGALLHEDDVTQLALSLIR